MIQLNLRYRYLLLFFIINIHSITSQICQHDIPDFFYNVDFSGPFFDQPVYTIQDFSVSNPINTPVFNFIVRPQTIYTRPSFFNSTVINSRALNVRSEDITVTSDHPSFAVQKSNDNYTLITNTYPLNYFSPFNRYLFKLIAKQTFSDRRQPVISTALVQINLTNYNVHAPIFIPNNQTFYIIETAEPNTQFGTVYATDADNDGIRYSMTDRQFSIDPSTGVLRLEQLLSSSPTEYSIDVTATDDGSSCSFTPSCPRYPRTTKIRIIVTAVNRNSPRFSNSICGQNASLFENNIIGGIVQSLTVLDDDRGENGLIDISFPSEHLRTTVSGLRNTAYSQFYLEQMGQVNTTRTAILRANEIFDYDKPDAIRVWYLFILATDNGKPRRQAFCSLRINLIDVNDNAPVFIMTFWNYTIYNSSLNTNNPRFLRIIASDADSGLNGKINYFIGTPNVPYFSIEAETGRIILRSDISNPASLNSSRFPITFQVYAQDFGTPRLFSRNNATVTIYYSNSNNPVTAKWCDPSYEELNISITEKFYELRPNQPIFETNGFNGSICYELVSQTPSIMTVSSLFFHNAHLPFRDTRVERNGNIFKSGIAVTSGLHAEIQNIYFLCIRVLVDPPLIGSVTIRLIDENDQIPTFDIRSIVLSVMENESGNRTIAQIQAFDRDVDPENNRVLYNLNRELSDNETIENFHVESDGTVWTNTIFGRENNKTLYRLFITAYNNKTAWNSTMNHTQDFQLDVQVISINNKGPILNNGSLVETVPIDETTVNGTNIFNITIVDADIDTNINLGILSGNLRNAFTFTLLSTNSDNSTRTQYEAIGQLKVVAPLDFESTPNYALVLFAFDARNIQTINVTVNLIPQNTKAPYFYLMPGFTSYQYTVMENTENSTLNVPTIQAYDTDLNSTQSLLQYEIYDNRRQLNLTNLSLNKINNHVTINITSPGLSRDLPFGNSVYTFSIRVTDENGTGVSSYVPVSIEVTDKNDKAPIPTNFSCINEGINSTILITFEDYDDPRENNTIPYRIEIINSSNFTLNPTISSNGIYELKYNGVLNRTITKNLTVTFNAYDNRNFSKLTTISIIVCDQLNTYPISDGSKNIKVIYVNGYQNSLRNVNLGSIYVNDLNDWFRTSRTYSIRGDNNDQNFSATQGLLSTSKALYPGLYTILVDVIKPNAGLSSALSTINLEVENVDSEYVRQASTIRIQGEYPETLIAPSLGDRLNTLRTALASLLQVPADSIIILAIRPFYQYQSPYFPPLPYDEAKRQALTDVIFYVTSFNKNDIENRLNTNLAQFSSRFGITAHASGPNPCNNYVCPTDTICRPTRTIQPLPYSIDTNQTSFVGINILDSADCVNSTYSTNFTNPQSGCTTNVFNSLTYCSCPSLQSYAPLGPYCQVLGRTFNENGGGYAIYAGTSFSNFAPTRFSFDFVVRSPIPNSLILLYGRNSPPIDDFFWIAIEIYQSKLRFYFRGTIFLANEPELNSSIWYHVECQFIHSTILVSINDCQYIIPVNNTLNTYNLSTVELYLGGLPMIDSVVSALYSSLTSVNTFNGCIRNVLSNGYYLDMSNNLSSANSNIGECSCLVTNSCIAERRVSDIIIPWYTWLIMALVFLFLATILALTLLTCIRKRQQLKVLTGLYTDDTRDNIVDYKETAGEEDHSTYNLRILKKPVYALSDGNIIPSNSQSSYNDPRLYRRPSLREYIAEKLDERVIPYANDTKLHYRYEGEGSIASNLSSIESPSLSNENDYRYLYSLGPKFSRLADLYASHTDDDNT